jgi:hypothetical protein
MAWQMPKTVCTMAKYRLPKGAQFTIVGNEMLRDMDISLKAKGLLAVMLSLPDDWEYSITGLATQCKESETAIKTAIDELKRHGYLTVTKIPPDKTANGRIKYIYDIYAYCRTN